MTVPGILILGLGYHETYRLWKVPVKEQLFYDLQLITGTSESIRAGHDPILNNAMDPGWRIFNYPAIWYWVLNLGLSRNIVLPLGLASLAVFFIVLAVFFRPRDGFTLGFLLLITFSSAFMLAYERLNVDLWFFSSVTLGILVLEASAAASFAIMVFGILFKIFPVLASGMYLEPKKIRTAWYAAASILLAVLYFVLTWQDMRHIFADTEKGNDYSYGVSVAPLFMKEVMGITAPHIGAFAYGLAALLIALACLSGLRSRGRLTGLPLREQRAFWAGAGIYAGTFLLGNNWDYRLIFTLLTVPALACWSRQGRGGARILALLTGCALLSSCWSMLIRGWLGVGPGAFMIGYGLDELANWILFFGLTALLTASLPDWIFDEARSLGRRITRQQAAIP